MALPSEVTPDARGLDKIRFAIWRSGWIVEAPASKFEAILRDHEARHGRAWIVGTKSSRVLPHLEAVHGTEGLAET